MYCRKCGKPIPEDSIYCPYCGTRIIVVEAKDDEKNEDISEKEMIAAPRTTVPLTEFAKEYGKMQLCKAADREGRLFHFATFTKITKVSLDDSVNQMSPSEIADNKDSIQVKIDGDNFIMESVKDIP